MLIYEAPFFFYLCAVSALFSITFINRGHGGVLVKVLACNQRVVGSNLTLAVEKPTLDKLLTPIVNVCIYIIPVYIHCIYAVSAA